MIKFFRKIRQKLLSEYKFSKYLLYALGEIILVVAGILIALQINKWNEAKNDRKTETQALINLQTEFEVNQDRLAFLMIIKQKQEDEGRAFLEIISNRNIPISKKLEAKTPGGFNGTWGASNSVLNSLLSTGDITKIQNDSLKFLLTNWFVYVERFEDQEKRHIAAVERKGIYLKNKHYKSIVKEGDHSMNWPGNYLPNDLSQQNDSLRAAYINDLEYYNLTSSIISMLYIQLIDATILSENYKKISRLLKQELENRNVDLSKSNYDRKYFFKPKNQ